MKVIGGRYEGDTGLIVRVEDNMIVLFSDLSMHEVRISLEWIDFHSGPSSVTLRVMILIMQNDDIDNAIVHLGAYAPETCDFATRC